MIRFFPEGGQLVEGIPSVVAFEATSKKEGTVGISGTVYGPDDVELAQFTTLHNGMGCFIYTPTDKTSQKSVVTYQDKNTHFKLPKALPRGYVLNVTSKEKALVIKVLRNSTSLKDTLALFISHQGRPLMYQTIDFKDQTVYHLPLSTQGLPGGVIQLSLMNSNGATLYERFCYVMPSPSLQLTATSPMHCTILLNLLNTISQ